MYYGLIWSIVFVNQINRYGIIEALITHNMIEKHGNLLME